MKLLKEFREFIARGNVVDMAVGKSAIAIDATRCPHCTSELKK